MPRSGSSRVGAGALVLMLGMSPMVGMASAAENKVPMAEAARSRLTRLHAAQKSSATYKAAVQEAARSKLSHFHAQHKRGDLFPAAGAASVVGAGAPSASSDAKLVAHAAGPRSAPKKGVRVAPTTARTGAGMKPMSASQREAFSARVEDVRAAAGLLMGEAGHQPPQQMAGTDDKSANDVTNASSNGGGGRRKLQSCAVGSGVTVTSSEFPLLEGCLAELGDGFGSATGAIISYLPDDGTAAIWFAVYEDTSVSEELGVACLTSESTSVHPSDATWFCTFPDGTSDYATATTFGVDCGCDDDSGSLPAPTPSPPTPTPPTPTTGGSCAEGGVTVTSSEFPMLEGCLAEFDGEFVSVTGAITSAVPDGETAAIWVSWYGDVSVPEELDIACLTAESTSVHPSDATWYCAFPDGTEGYATPTTFGVDCGCFAESPVPAATDPPVVETPGPVPAPTEPPVSETPAPVPAPTDPPVMETPAPVPAPTDPPVMETPAPTAGSRVLPTTPVPATSSSATASPPAPAAGGDCAADSSLGVTSTTYPLLEGCLEEVVIVEGGELEYMSSTGLILAFADETTPTEEYWYVFYGDVTLPEELEAACRSEELASAVHPSEAKWFCLDPAGETYAAAASDLAVDCGCGTAPTPGTPAPAVSAADPTAVPSVVTQPPGGLPTPEPTSRPSATSRGNLGSAAPSAGTSSEPIGIPDVVFPDATTMAPSAAGTIAGSCGATDSFQIVSSALPDDVEGCYKLTDQSFSNAGSFSEAWTMSGTTAPDQVMVVGSKEGGELEAESYPYYLAFVSSEEDGHIIYCFSSEEAATVHPAEATWLCDLNGTESFDEVTDADVSFTCGCTDTPAPATDAPPIGGGTPSPASAPTTGAGDASGSVAARSLGSSTLAAATALVTAAAFVLAMGG